MLLPQSPRARSWTMIAALFALLLVLCATRVLSDPDESRYAEVGRWMLVSGDWVAPRVDGIPFFHKPPLVYWLEAAAIAVFGANAWAVRLVPASHALLMLVALYLAAREIGGEPLARRAALMLGTSMAFLLGGQYVNHDMAVAAWISVAIWCFALYFDAPERRARLALLGFAACAFGVLSKGLIGIVLPALVLLPWLVAVGRWRRIAGLPWWRGLGLFALITVPWFVVVEQRFPGTLAYLFGVQHFARYTATNFNNPRAWWYYLPALVALVFPWCVLAAATLRREAGERERWRLLGWIWLVAIVGFFSIPKSKLIGYVLPVVPPIALLAALGYERLLARSARWGSALRIGACVALIAALGLQVPVAHESGRKSASDMIALVRCEVAPTDTIYVLGGYPYDLPFYLQTDQRLIVVADWPLARRLQLDDWRTELMDGARFDPAAGTVLQEPDVLKAAAQRPDAWVFSMLQEAPRGFALVRQGRYWGLYRSLASAAKSPEAAQRKGLPRCDDQRQQ